MKLITAHKILIASGVGFFVFFGIHRMAAFRSDGDPTVLATAAGGLLAAIGLAIYYRSIGRRR